LRLLKTKDQNIFIGFTVQGRKQIVEIEKCPIAMPAVSDFLPELKRLACEKLPEKYSNANLVVKTGDDGRVRWGGIGRRSLKMAEDDLFWTEVEDRRIHYSLDSFFQANLSILPELFRRIRSLGILSSRTRLYDIYGGVGLFGICLGSEVGEVVLLEENIYAVATARYNARYNGFANFSFYEGRMEDHADVFAGVASPSVAVIDPPRSGLSPSACDLLCAAAFDHLLYLSCDPQSMSRDLRRFLEAGWQALKIIPFDFFPRTKHIETLVLLRRRS
jgi:23S rRNA (uracil1939-C5)-methyltransferase/tRNA (uracil-5-)-methyltransferase